MRLKGKRALVTGGSRGIGAAIARRFAAEGADVALTYNSSAGTAQAVADDIAKLGRKSFIIQANASAPETLRQPIEKIISELGGLDILVNNAGVGIAKLIDDMTLREFDDVMNVNVRGVFETTRLCIPQMKSGGRVIFLGSILGERAVSESVSAYNTSKFSVAGLGRSLAHDLGKRNITVNVIQPGPINTDMNPDDGGDNAKTMISATALKRYGTVEEVANLAVFIASDESSYITGAAINVDGGMNA